MHLEPPQHDTYSTLWGRAVLRRSIYILIGKDWLPNSLASRPASGPSPSLSLKHS